MSAANKMTIAGHSVALRFGFSVFRLLGEYWELKSLDQVIGRVVNAGVQLESGSTDFDVLQVVGDLVMAAVKAATENESVTLTRDDVMDALIYDPKSVAVVLKEFASALPQAKPDQPGKRKAAK